MEPAKNEVGFGNLRTSEKSSMTFDSPKSVILACPFSSTKMLLWEQFSFVQLVFSDDDLGRGRASEGTYPFEVSVDDGRFEVV